VEYLVITEIEVGVV